MTRRIRANHRTRLGKLYRCTIEDFLESDQGKKYRGKANLVFTSPPFPLNKKKRYGNLNGESYLKWLSGLAAPLSDLIVEDGSIVLEVGNSWEQGRPIQSLLPMQTLLAFVNSPGANLRLCQQFVNFNPARLPSPAQWVTIERIRVTDSFTHVWWMAKSDYPKADNTKILRPYSRSMRSLLRRRDYNSGRRPSEHRVSPRSFRTDNGGGIPPNLLELEPIEVGREVRLPDVMSFANTSSNDFYLRECRRLEIDPHPARMAPELAAFFIEFLTEPGDLVIDPFAGSNTTGYVAELLGRRWASIEPQSDYARHSAIRMRDPALAEANGKGRP